VRTLLGDGHWEWPEGRWVRANMVSSVDGSAQGADGRTGSINNEVDVEVFQQLRDSADVILVGVGTARAEGYGPVGTPMRVVGHALPAALEGVENVALVGGPVAEVVAHLFAEGFRRVLCEGGPTLLASLVAEGLLDELCLTMTPRLVAGPGKRILDGAVAGDVPLELASLVEHEGTLLARWLVSRP
jgi:riboflavin biosynthesis pyrimidine reductase